MATSPSNLTLHRYKRTNQGYIEDLGNGVTLTLMLIPAGEFMMGALETETGSQGSERPQHLVKILQFLMGRTPITQAQWKAVAELPQVELSLDPAPSNFKFNGKNHPVERVSWYEAIEFCKRLSAHTGRQYGLPSEAEWEYACRAGTTTPFHFGEMITTKVANYNGRAYAGGATGGTYVATIPVNYFNVANAFGLCDMHGNVWEWCEDHWHENYEGMPIDGSAWLSKDEQADRIVRGGSWDFDPGYCRSASRYFYTSAIRYITVGFRVVCRAP